MSRLRDGRRGAELPPCDWLLLGSLYTTQYLGLGFFVVGLVSILRERGAGFETLGLVYMLGLVWPLKVLWAPWVDRIGFGSWGRYRGWLLLTQSTLVALLLLIGTFDIAVDFNVIYGLCLALALASATQDIATDGLACLLLPPVRRGIGNGLQIAGGMLGNLLGGGATLMLYPQIGWSGCMVLLAAMTAVSLLQVVLLREPERPDIAVQPRLFRRLVSFWRPPGRRLWLALLLLSPMGSGIAYALMTPALVDAGWDIGRIGLMVNVAGSIIGLAAALAAGWLIGRHRRRTILFAFSLVQMAGIAGVAVLVLDPPGRGLASLAVVLFFLCYNPMATALATLMMDHASPSSPATDYTMQACLHQLASIGMMVATAALVTRIGNVAVLVLAFASAAATVALSLAYRAEHTAPA